MCALPAGQQEDKYLLTYIDNGSITQKVSGRLR